MSMIKKIGKIIIPSQKLRRLVLQVFRIPAMVYFHYLILLTQKKHKIALAKVKKKEKIKIVFFVIHASVWKYDLLYELFEKDERFEPIIVICPYTIYNHSNMLKEMELSYNLFINKKYRVIKTFLEETNEWLNVKKQIQPDIIFFTNPHDITRFDYLINNFLDRLTCYVQYSFPIMHLYEMQYNLKFHNLLWKAFYETNMHKQFAIQYADNNGKNVIVSGYPGTDKFLDKEYLALDPWEIKDKRIKRIIWAPHHTIEGQGNGLDYSCFIEYAEFMLETARKYQDKIQITFKPHPILKPKLVQEKDWGQVKTEEYFESWNNLSNGQLSESEYVDLFLTSDAMIHDSASFTVEYLYVNKPVLFTARDNNVINRFNEFGKLCYKLHYHALNESDIIHFIENIVLTNNDLMSEKRKSFINNYLVPPNGESASKNIIDEISRNLE